MKKTFYLLSFVLMVWIMSIGASSCDSPDKVQTRQTEKIMGELQKQVGMPNIVNFSQKKLMKMILEECDKSDLICYAYLKSDYTGKLTYLGKCIGYGIPFSAQYTNPMKIVKLFEKRVPMPQPDPNGLYMPTSSSATWLLLIDPKTNKPHVTYIEPEIVVSAFKL